MVRLHHRRGYTQPNTAVFLSLEADDRFSGQEGKRDRNDQISKPPVNVALRSDFKADGYTIKYHRIPQP